MSSQAPIDVFIAYSQADKALLDRLVIQLRSVERFGLIDSWHDGEIQAGSNREEAILAAMRKAEVILLLISADFLASEFSYEKEIKLAKELHDQKSAVMIPVILKDCFWQDAFPGLIVLPRNGKAVVNKKHWQSPDQAFQEVVQTVVGISKALREGKAISDIQVTVKESTTTTTHYEKTVTVSKKETSPSNDQAGKKSNFWKYLAVGVIAVGLLSLFLLNKPFSKKSNTPDQSIGQTTATEQGPNTDQQKRDPIPESRPTQVERNRESDPVKRTQRATLPFITIGNLDWMSQNLNKPMSREAWCPNEQESQCEKYGRYYTQRSAKAACPNGWRLPSKAEWLSLSANDLKKLKLSKSGFYNKATIQLGTVGNYWASDASGGGEYWCFKFKDIQRSRVDRQYGHFGVSCRCVSKRQ